MKSYFAKLADRATLSNSPASPRVNPRPTKDPFEANESGVQSTADLSKRVFAENARLTPVAPVTQVLDHLNPLRQRSQPAITHSSPDLETPSDDDFSREGNQPVAKLTPSESDSAQPRMATPKLTPPPLSIAAPGPVVAPAADLPVDEATAGESANDARLAGLDREQETLLRKADLFMNQFLSRRSSPPVNRQVEPSEKSAVSGERHPEIEQPTRLAAVAPVHRVAEPAEPPSLVIGKLTVEIAPPAAPAREPPTKIVVVNRSKGQREAMPPSGRFGLSQF